MVPQAVKLLQSSLGQWRRGVASGVKLHPMAKGALTYAVMWPTGSLIQQALEGRKLRKYPLHSSIASMANSYPAPITNPSLTICRGLRLGQGAPLQLVWSPVRGAHSVRLGAAHQRHVAADQSAHGHRQGKISDSITCSSFSGLSSPSHAPLQAITEQLSYGPFACVSFFMGMSLLELKTFSQAVDETKEKAAPTYKVTPIPLLAAPNPLTAISLLPITTQVGVCIWPFLQTINFSLVPEHNRVVFVSICSLMWTIFLAYMKTRHEEQADTADLPCT